MCIAAPVAAEAPIEGHWTNPKGSVIVEVERCGPAHCGVVRWASEKAKQKARDGGTPELVGTSILTGLRRDGEGRYKGRVFLPRRNMHAAASVERLGPKKILVRGCVLAGLVCDAQRWTRVSNIIAEAK